MTSKAAWSSSFQLAPRRSSISSDDEGWEEHLRTTPDSVIIRSLRRRLWQAFMKEDDAVAVRCYTSTRPDWMRWMIQERNEKREKHQAIKGARLRGMIGHGACAKRSNEYLVKKSAAGRDTADSPSPAKLHGSGKCGLLELNMNPTDPFTADDFKHPQDSFDDVDDQAKEKRRRTNNHKRIHGHATARQAFSLFRFNTKEPFGHLIAGNSSHDSNDDSITAMTTPLHEAARLGNATLVRCMLAHPQVDCDVLNGQGRTILHCVAGGLTRSEAKYLHVNDDADTGDGEVGIRAPKPPGLHENENGVTEETSVKKAARAVSRLFRLRGESGIPPDKTACRGARVRVEGHEQHQLDLERMDVTTAVLRWTRPAAAESNLSSEKEALQPYDPSLSTGVSTNAVDSGLGRTALHYAAELGRSTLCEAILQSFYGTMLTIIDCTGRNPCELAAAGGFDQLAAYLEARALLYVDPYGTDEDLLAAITANESVLGGCVPPFGWFETLSVAEVQQRRERRIAQAKEKMRQIAAKLRIRQHARKTIHEYVHQNAASTNDNALVDETTTVTTDDAEAAVVDDEDEFFDVPSFEHSTLGGEARDAALVSSAIIDLVDDRDFSVFERLIHEGHVERFLSFHHWDIKKAFVDFTSDPFAAFQAAEVTLPRIEEHSKCADNKHSICLICCDEFDVESKAWKVLADCIHSFCVNCLQDYLAKCAKSKMGVVIKCPHHECESLLSPSEIYDLSSESEAFDKLLTSANDNFVVSASTFRFCPHPGCGQKGAVKINVPNSWKESKVAGSGILELVGAVCTNVANDRPDKGEVHDSVDEQNCDAIVTYEGIRDDRYYNLTSCVQPKRAHRFCFQCGEKFIHWPVRCEQLIEWKNIINKEMDDVDVGDRDAKDGSNFNDVAQSLWIKANTRPCPKVSYRAQWKMQFRRRSPYSRNSFVCFILQCKAHIQKNDGCNHMTCSNPNCKHEFCWICRNDWKLHNTETGGTWLFAFL